MPRSIQEILDHADELAERFENYEPADGDERPVEEYMLERAALDRARSERQVIDAVIAARAAGPRGRRSAACWARRRRPPSSATPQWSSPSEAELPLNDGSVTLACLRTAWCARTLPAWRGSPGCRRMVECVLVDQWSVSAVTGPSTIAMTAQRVATSIAFSW